MKNTINSQITEDDIQKYIRCMEEIKLRDQVIEDHLTGKRSTGQRMTDIELVCLQFRKIGELIVLSTLCALKEEYRKVCKNIEKQWEAAKIRKTLDKIHSAFYPVPFERVFDPTTGVQKNDRLTDGFLSKDECISLIGRCGKILHGFNPYDDKRVFGEIQKIEALFPEWQNRIRRLLKMHEIRLLGTSLQLWVYMARGPKHQILVEERVPTT